jgi:hypothetical protein
MKRETYAEAIEAARSRYDFAMGEAAADILVIAEKYGKPLQTVCKDIDPDNWNALRQRARRLQKSQVKGEKGAVGAGPVERFKTGALTETDKRGLRYARQLMSDPMMATEVLKDVNVRAATVQAARSFVGTPRTTPLPEPTWGRKGPKTLGDKAVALGIDFSATLTLAIEANQVSEQNAREIDEIVAELLESLKEVNV